MILQGRLLIESHRIPEPGWVAVEDGRIADLGDGDPPGKPAAGGEGALICPGFIDAHLHLPQFEAPGCDGMELLQWLSAVVFPAEIRWRDPDVARWAARRAYASMLRAGTLGYAGFLTSHAHGIEALLDAARHVPLRAIAGQVLMDRNAPEALIGHPVDPAPPAARGCRVTESVNPRFAVGCSEAMLRLAATKAAGGAFIQTHVAESRGECALARKLFPDDPHDVNVLDRHGLLTDRTLLAHCLHLGDAQWSLIAQRGSVVVHCPTANTFLASGLFDFDAARSHGVRLALGSDVAAGPDVAMPRVARAMIETAKVRLMTAARGMTVRVPTPAEAWELITRGNADALGFHDGGRLEVGAAADLLILRLPFEVDDHLVGRLLHSWRDEYIEHRVVNGALVDVQGLRD